MIGEAPVADRFWALLDAACTGTLNESQAQELGALLESDSAVRSLFIDHMQLRRDIQAMCRAERVFDRTVARIGAILPQVSSSCSSAPAPTFLSTSLHAAFGYFSEGMPLAYLLATVIVGVGLLIGSRIYVSGPEQLAGELLPSKNNRATHDPRMPFVGRITGMVDCQWADPQTEAFNGANVPLGRQYALRSGLMEITYDTGAKVILQGPVTYEVESPVGGYLSLGKLTARVEKKEEPRTKNEELPGSRSSFLIPHSYFAVRTPTATVTDLGTEFGVVVDKSGGTTSHVFRGSVRLQATSSDEETEGTTRVLHESESARVQRTGESGEKVVVVRCKTAKPETFVRSIRRDELSPYAKAVLKDRPLAYWPLSDPPGVRRIADRSGNGHDGLAIGLFRSGKQGPFTGGHSLAFEFTGHGYVEIDSLSNCDPAKGMTVEAWAMCNGGEEPQSVITHRDNEGGYMLYAHPDVWEFSTRNGAATDVWDSIFRPIIHEQWTHVVGTFEPTGEKSGTAMVGVKKFYVNGNLVAAEKQRLAASLTRLLRIGAGATEMPTGGEFFFNGRIAEVAVYDRPLSADRIKAHCEAGKTPSGALGFPGKEVPSDN